MPVEAQTASATNPQLRKYFDRWLRQIVIEQAPISTTDKEVCGLLIWLATGCVDQRSNWNPSQRHKQQAEVMNKHFLQKHNLNNLAAVIEFGTVHDPWNDLIHAAVLIMTPEQVRWFAQYLKVDLTDEQTRYRIDAEYLKFKRKADVLELAKLAGMDSIKGMNVGQIKAVLLRPEYVERIGVPVDIQAIYAEEFAQPDTPLETIDESVFAKDEDFSKDLAEL